MSGRKDAVRQQQQRQQQLATATGAVKNVPCRAGLMIMITNRPQVLKSETFWHAALRSSRPHAPHLLPPTCWVLCDWGCIWRIFTYNSFICPFIHFENVNSCASSLFDYSCFILIYISSFLPFPFPYVFQTFFLSHCPPVHCLFVLFRFSLGGELHSDFSFSLSSFFCLLENSLINWGRNHYKRNSYS